MLLGDKLAILNSQIQAVVSMEELLVDGQKKPDMKGIKHVAFNEAWLRIGD